MDQPRTAVRRWRAHAGCNVWNVLQAIGNCHFDFFNSVSEQMLKSSEMDEGDICHILVNAFSRSGRGLTG